MTYLLNEASVHYEEKRWEECTALCERALERGRELGAGYAVYAKCYLRMGNVAYAQGALARALELYERSTLEQRSEEVSAKVRKVKAELKEAATRAYQDPALGAEAKERGNAAFKAGKWADAIREYTDAIARDPSNAAYYQNRATAQAKVMNYGGALEDCERALKLDPKYVKAMNRKGNCQVAMKEYHKAIATFREALALEPSNADSLDGMRLTQGKINEGSRGGANDEERSRRAMEDPEIQLLLRDPMVNAALEDLQKDQASAAKVFRDPVMKAKIEKLIGAWRGSAAARARLQLPPALPAPHASRPAHAPSTTTHRNTLPSFLFFYTQPRASCARPKKEGRRGDGRGGPLNSCIATA